MTSKTDAPELSLLVVDDDNEIRVCVARYLTRKGFSVEEASSGAQAIGLLETGRFDIAILDLGLPGMSGMEVLGRLKDGGCQTEVIVLTGSDDVKSVVSAMQHGARNYLTKPVAMGDLAESIEAVCKKSAEPRKERQRAPATVRRTEKSNSMFGNSPVMKQLLRTVDRAGRSEHSMLIQGESGTGKELVAKALHAASSRADTPMVTINCAALPESLLESELFGHEKGSFTGATAQKPGLFEIADGGTLFIDEVGELSPALQPKLLRVLEDGSFRRIGSPKERRVDVRIIAATNRKMDVEVAEGRFREDLYYRINVMTLELPRLQDRGGDILYLASYFAGPEWSFDDQARQVLKHYHWPGNVRQLINVIERAKVLGDDYVIRAENFPASVRENQLPAEPVASLEIATDLASVNRACVIEALRQQDGNKKETAKTLGVSRRSLYRLLEKHNIQPDDIRNPAMVG